MDFRLGLLLIWLLMLETLEGLGAKLSWMEGFLGLPLFWNYSPEIFEFRATVVLWAGTKLPLFELIDYLNMFFWPPSNDKPGGDKVNWLWNIVLDWMGWDGRLKYGDYSVWIVIKCLDGGSITGIFS